MQFWNILSYWSEKFQVNEVMVGLKKAEAGSDMIVARKQKKPTVLKEDFEEEWGGITVDM